MTPTYHVVSHSHWDREWYFPFERFRGMLVDMMEDLLELLDRDPAFSSYTLDGQMAMVCDYLELRPDRVERVRALVESGRLFIGPWYILSDEFLPSGESHIRNLALGISLGRLLGGAMRVGYIPDQFGHIAQMPQILQGFGIETAIIYRGFGGEPGQEPSEYWWVSPDGSRVLMHHLPKDGYSGGYFATDDEQIILAKFERLRKELDARATTSHRLFLNGGDHHWPDPKVTHAIEVLRRRAGARVVHSNLVEFLAAVRREIGEGAGLPLLAGETRFGYRHAFVVLGGIYSSRMYLKQLNAECQLMVERYVEPLHAIAVAGGMRSRAEQIRRAWIYILQNQDHDAICGTGVDEVHQEMVIRYKKARQIADHVLAVCTEHLLPQEEAGCKDDRYVFVFNPSPFARTEIIEADIDFHRQDVVVGLNPDSKIDAPLPRVTGFKLRDHSGAEVPFQVLGRRETFSLRYSKHDYPRQALVERFTVLLPAKNIPPLGWTGLRVERSDAEPRFRSQLQCGERFVENEFLRVDCDADGTVSILHKESGAVFRPMNVFEDSGDVGDEFNYSYPEKDRTISSQDAPARVALVETGPLRARLQVEYRMLVPSSATPDERARSDRSEELLIRTSLSLTASSRRVDVHTTVHNTAKDHRLRVVFKTGIDTDHSLAESPFAVVEREHVEYDTRAFPYEHPAAVAPMQRWVTIADNNKGFTLITKGLPEYELSVRERGTLALTLLRCVGKLSGSNLATRPGGAAGWWNETPDAQCPGDHCFDYALYPHSPSDLQTWGSILEEVERFTIPPLAFKRKSGEEGLEELRTEGAFRIAPEHLVLSALKEAEDHDGLILRICDPAGLGGEASISSAQPIQEAALVTLAEENMESVPVIGGRELRVRVRPYQIVTVRVKLRAGRPALVSSTSGTA